jgi:hypothetical protein
MSGLPPFATEPRISLEVGFVPKADMNEERPRSVSGVRWGRSVAGG